MKQLFIVLFLCAITVFSFPQTVFAATKNSTCDFLTGEYKSRCAACMGTGKEAVWTAFGCLPTSSGTFVTELLKRGAGIAGGIAFLLIVIGGFQIVMSAGNPEKLNEGKELVFSAIVGLLFIVFSVFILRFIGVELLSIPGFN